MEQAYKFGCLSSKLERAFGERAVPLREAIRQTVEWYRNNFNR